MAISKMSSKQLMDILDNSESQISDIRSDVNNMKLELDKQLSVFSNAFEYSLSEINELKEYYSQQNIGNKTILILSDQEILEGSCAKYGMTITPSYTVSPANVFNFQSTAGPIFKNNANVYIDNNPAPTHIDMLMDDAIKSKSTPFEELTNSNLTLKVTVNPADLFGSTSFNTIEMLPYIAGSFDILAIRIYTLQDYKSGATTPTYDQKTIIPSVGASKIILPEVYDLYSIEFDIKINFRNSAYKFPFGFKHLYFLNANYNDNSKAIVKLSREKYIDYISDAITIHDQDGIRETFCSEEGIKVYAVFVNGNLSSEIELVKGVVQSSIARNIKDVYVEIPIKKSIISLKFNEIGER